MWHIHFLYLCLYFFRGGRRSGYYFAPTFNLCDVPYVYEFLLKAKSSKAGKTASRVGRKPMEKSKLLNGLAYKHARF